MMLISLLILSCVMPPKFAPTFRPPSLLFVVMVFMFKPPVNPKRISWADSLEDDKDINKKKIEKDENLFIREVIFFIDKDKFTIIAKKQKTHRLGVLFCFG